MPRLPLLRLAAPLAAAVTAGCDTPTGLRREQAPRPAALSLTVVFADSGPLPPFAPPGGPVPAATRAAGFTIDGFLDPGAVAGGRARAVESDTLRVAGTTLIAVRPRSGGAGAGFTVALQLPPYVFNARMPLAASEFGGRVVTIEGVPRVEGVAPDPLPGPLYAVGRAGPDTLTVNVGDDIVLRLALPPGAPPPLEPFRPNAPPPGGWNVVVRSPANPALPPLVTLGGIGRPPAVVRINTGLLPPPPAAGPPGPLVVELSTQQSYFPPFSSTSVRPGYSISLNVLSRLRWFVRAGA